MILCPISGHNNISTLPEMITETSSQQISPTTNNHFTVDEKTSQTEYSVETDVAETVNNILLNQESTFTFDSIFITETSTIAATESSQISQSMLPTTEIQKTTEFSNSQLLTMIN